MKLEVGMYVRTDGKIEKIKELGYQDEKYVSFSKDNTHLIYKDEIKASHNLLGNDKEPCLIEVGDYVNGYKLLYQDSHYSYFDTDICDWIYIKKDEQIKSIVTKEQFSSMKYKVGE